MAIPFLGPILGAIGKGGKALFGGAKPKIDPMMAAMLGLSAFGGDDQQEIQSFRQPGQITDPMQHMYQQLSSIYRMGQGLAEAGPPRLRSSYVQAPPAPVSIPGIPFQIGGGLGVDPALADPSLLEGRGTKDAQKYDPFQSIAQQQFDAANPEKQAKLRTPSNG